MTAADVKSLRTRLRLTQNELARLLDTNAMTVSRWECGRSRPQPYFRKRMRDLLRTANTGSMIIVPR